MPLFLIVKGHHRDALAQGLARNIPLVAQSWTVDEVYCHCDAQHEQKVLNWFCETSGPAPYPAGTLLWYTRRLR